MTDQEFDLAVVNALRRMIEKVDVLTSYERMARLTELQEKAWARGDTAKYSELEDKKLVLEMAINLYRVMHPDQFGEV